MPRSSFHRLSLLALAPLLLAAAPKRAKLPYEFPPDTAPANPAAADAAKTDATPPSPPANPYLHDETRAEAEARAQAMFARMDLNQDGFVTLAEMNAYVAARTPSRTSAPAAKPAKGRKAQPARLMLGRVPPVPPLVRSMFDDADADHDGRISAEESKAAADRGFDETDTNHDGVVSPAERMAAVQDVADDKPAKRKADDMVGR